MPERPKHQFIRIMVITLPKLYVESRQEAEER